MSKAGSEEENKINCIQFVTYFLANCTFCDVVFSLELMP